MSTTHVIPRRFSDTVTAADANPRRWLILAVSCSAALMIVLDVTVMNLALPSAQRALGFSNAFGEVFRSEGLRIITTLPKTPRMNAICERVNGTLRRELLDRILIVGERHLARVLREYVAHYNGHRPHQSRRQRPRIWRRSLSGMWPTCDRSAENASSPE